jgi:hypothetical protein
MAETDVRNYRFEQPRNLEAAAAWIVVFAVVIDVVFLGFVAWNAWTVEKESRRVFALLEASAQACRATIEASVPVRYDDARWKTSFELPAGNFASVRTADDDAIEVSVARRPDSEDLASSNALYDTTVRVHIGPSTGFSRYYAKPYTEYGGYRRFTAVGRAAIGYTDPEGAADSVQVILIDDTRNDREIAVTYTAIVEGAETLAFGIIDTMRLAPMEKQEVAVKPGWKLFNQDPLRLQYPEDYRVTTPFPGRVIVDGKGGRIEITSAYDLDEAGRRGATSTSNGDGGTPDEFFLLQYGVSLRVAFFYGNDATAYDRSVLKEIGSTISLNE